MNTVSETYVVKMAEISVIKNNGGSVPSNLKTTLGSCVGVILTDRKSGVHGLAHIMLPEMLKRDPAVGKYADTAIPALLGEMKKKGRTQLCSAPGAGSIGAETHARKQRPSVCAVAARAAGWTICAN